MGQTTLSTGTGPGHGMQLSAHTKFTNHDLLPAIFWASVVWIGTPRIRLSPPGRILPTDSRRRNQPRHAEEPEAPAWKAMEEGQVTVDGPQPGHCPIRFCDCHAESGIPVGTLLARVSSLIAS